MIFIAVKFTVRADRGEEWLELVEDFTQATRREAGNVFFEWSRSVQDPHQFVLLEAFESGQAGTSHVNSEHFRTAMAWMPDVITKTPEIINVEVPQDGWGQMGELTPRQ
ncbi:MAG: putative quinol monooxygenase [Pseudonocardiaceae bacterium]